MACKHVQPLDIVTYKVQAQKPLKPSHQNQTKKLQNKTKNPQNILSNFMVLRGTASVVGYVKSVGHRLDTPQRKGLQGLRATWESGESQGAWKNLGSHPEGSQN